MSQQYILKTLGCKANLYDSQLIEQDLQKRGWAPSPPMERSVENQALPLDTVQSTSNPNKVQLCIVNSCTVTHEADKQSRKMAAKLARDYPEATIVVTGCGAEVDPEAYKNSKGVDLVIGNQNKNRFVDLLPLTSHILKPESPQVLGTVENYTDIISRHPMDRHWPSALDSFATPPTHLLNQEGTHTNSATTDRTRSFLKIQEGCDSFCTYCIIPYGRGPSRSLRPREIVKQIAELVSQGVREVILTGTNIGDYGSDWSDGSTNRGEPLSDLLELILGQTALERLRISSLDPSEITPGILALMERNPRLCPHFHVSLQSPVTKILRLMKRHYTTEDVKDCLHRIAQVSAPLGGVYVGMDIITGFPGETDEDFEAGFKLLQDLPWSRLHVFPYSERARTPATRLPNSVPQSVRVSRMRRLTQLSMERLKGNYSSILKTCQTRDLSLENILTERPGAKGWTSGFTPNYLKVLFPPGLTRNQKVGARPIDLMIDSMANDVALVAQ